MKALLFVVFFALLSPSPQADHGKVSGTVVLSEKAIPLSGAEVVLNSRDDPTGRFRTTARATSDKDGHFVIEDVPPGPYVINVTSSGMVRAMSDQRPERMFVTIESGKESSGVVVTMSPETVIEGHVIDPDGQPSWGARIEVRTRDGQLQGSYASVDEKGDFKLRVQPGQLVISADYAPAETDSVRTYYPGVADRASAIPLNLSEGDTRSGISFRMQHSTKVRISGSISDPFRSSATIDGRVFLEPKEAVRSPQNFSPSVSVVQVPGKENPSFEFEDIRTGDYTLFAVMKEGGGRFSFGRTLISIGANDVTGLVVAVRPGVEVRGHITFPAPRDPNDPVITPHLDADPTNLPLIIREAIQLDAVTVDSNSNFTISNVPQGEYWIQLIKLSPDAALLDARLGTRRLVNNVLSISGVVVDPLELTVGPAATISGTVLDISGKPVARAPVWLLPEKNIRRGYMRIRLTQTDANGKFSLRGISPGNYTAISLLTNDPDEVERNELSGYSVSAKSGESIDINLTISIPFPK